MIDDDRSGEGADHELQDLEGLLKKVEIGVPSERFAFGGNRLDDFGGGGFAPICGRKARRTPRTPGAWRRFNSLRDTSSVRLARGRGSAVHVMGCTDCNAVVGTVSGGLNDDESLDPHFANEDHFLFVPWGGKRWHWFFGGAVEGAMTRM